MVSSQNKMAASGLLASVTKDHFYDDVAIETYERIVALVARDSRVPVWEELLIDPKISEEGREELEAYNEIKPVRRDKRIHKLYDNLDTYRKARVLYGRFDGGLKELNKSKVDVDTLISDTVDDLLKAQVSARKNDQVINIGTKNDNSDPLLEKLLSGERASVIRTGFRTFDERNGGIMLGSLWVIAATTGGGKSAMVTALMRSMSAAGNKVCGVPLEMSDLEMMARIVSNTAEIDLKKYLFTKLTEREKEITRERWAKYKSEIKRLGGACRIFEPESDMSIEEILTLLRPYNDEVIIIDYIGLLKGVDGDDQWRQLGKAARYAKIWARNNNRVVVLLAQLSDEGAIRYARSIQEHSNNLWAWTYGERNRETGIIDVLQLKARNQESFEFQLGHDFSTMRMFDLDGQDDVERDLRRDKKGIKKANKMREAAEELKDHAKNEKGRRSRDKGRKMGKGDRTKRKKLKDRSA